MKKQIKFCLCFCGGESFSFGMVTKKMEVKLRGTFIWRRDYGMCKQNSVHINQWFFPLKHSPIPIKAMVNIMCLHKYLFFLFIFPWKKKSHLSNWEMIQGNTVSNLYHFSVFLFWALRIACLWTCQINVVVEAKLNLLNSTCFKSGFFFQITRKKINHLYLYQK